MRMIPKKELFKKKPLLIAEAQSEKFLAKLRFFSASLGALISLSLFAFDKINFTICSVQIALIILACIYNAMFLFEQRSGPLYQYVSYISSVLDIAIASAFIWTFQLADFPSQWIMVALLPAYFLIICSTALHNKQELSLMTGIFSALSYTFLGYMLLQGDKTHAVSFFILFGPGIVMLLLASLLCSMVSHNNLKSISKIIDSEGRFFKLGKTLPLLLFKIDRAGNFLWVQATSNAQFSIPTEKMIGTNIKDFVEEKEDFKFEGAPVQGTFKVKNFDSEMRYVDLVIVSDMENYNPEILEGSMVDVTDREFAISQREEMEQRLFQYQKTESLGTLASGMAHDFNNILQTVTEITARVSKDTQETQTRHEMELISETLTDARFLISELLALGRKKPLDYVSLNLAEFLKNIVPLYNEQLGDLYEVKLILREENLWIQGDADYLKRVFQNLVGNSRDAMPGGGIITIECSLLPGQGDDKSIVIKFSDTGVGIPDKIADKIFDPFFTTKKKGKGTGLGLALARRIISLHKGTIAIEKTDRHGTTFRIEIPESGKSTSEIDTTSLLINRVSTTVLILDDDPKMRKILNFFLTELAYKTIDISTMEEGLKVLKEHMDECKVLVMDWKLGDKDPHEVIMNFRSVKPDLLIIVVSGYQPIQKSIKKMNIYKWLTKPYDKNRLDLEIQKALYLSAKEKA